MSETDPLRAALRDLRGELGVLADRAAPSHFDDGVKATAKFVDAYLYEILTDYPAAVTYPEYGTRLAGFDGRAEVNREVAESVLFEGTNRQLVQRQVTAWEPVKDFAPSPGHVKNRAETSHMEEA